MAYTEKDLFALCKKIKDSSLRAKVEDFIKNLTPSHPEFKLALKLENVPAAPISRLTKEGGMIQHTVAVAEIAESFAREMEKVYGVKMNIDYLIAASILHDLYKAVEWGFEAEQYMTVEITLGHLDLMLAELYARKFPKEIIHIVAAHFGPNSPTPPLTYEALVMHYADSFASVIETNVSRTEELEKQLALILTPPKESLASEMRAEAERKVEEKKAAEAEKKKKR